MPTGIIKSYIPNGNSFTEDVNGHLRGIEWGKNNGNSFRVIFTSEAMPLNLLDKTTDYYFVKEMREDGDIEWFLKSKYRFDGTEFINNNVGNQKFGKMVAVPYLPDGSLKPNTVPFIDYYIEGVILGKYTAIPLYQTLLDIVANKENVTI